LRVILFRDLYLIHITQFPSFLGIIVIDAPQDEVLSWITSCFIGFYHCFFTLSTSRMDCLYSPMFGNGAYLGRNYISWSTSLLGGNHLVSLNTSLYSLKISSKWCFWSSMQLLDHFFVSLQNLLQFFFILFDASL
jgi:hypothetical protein